MTDERDMGSSVEMAHTDEFFMCEGLRCLVRYVEMPGIEWSWWAGYVRLPDGCDLPEHYRDAPKPIMDAAHGGLVFSGTPVGVPDGDGIWYGFDMNHGDDIVYDRTSPKGRNARSRGDAMDATKRLARAIRNWVSHPHRKWEFVHGDGRPWKPGEVDMYGHDDFRFIIDEYGVPAVLYMKRDGEVSVQWHGSDPDWKVMPIDDSKWPDL